MAGRIRAVGKDVEEFAPGDRVAALLNDFGRGPRAGGYAELAVAHASMVAQVPDGLDLALAAAAAVNGVTAWVALHELARVGPRDRVAVFGASGGLGSIACRIAAAAPARQVIGVVGSERTQPHAPVECTDVMLAADFGESAGRSHPPDDRRRAVRAAIRPVRHTLPVGPVRGRRVCDPVRAPGT